MTRRERLEAKMAKRHEWAEKAEARAAVRFKTASDIVSMIPLGQPILVGHYSEKRHRRAIDRMAANMTKGCVESKLAGHHVSKAGGLADQLERTIFSDDENAVAELEAKIAKLEGERERAKAINAAWRKAKKPAHTDADGWARIATALGVQVEELADARSNMVYDSLRRGPFPSYVSQNLGGRIKQAKDRIGDIKRRQARAAKAEAAGGVVVEGTGEYVRVTFSEKPERSVIDALKAADFRWGGGSWTGRRDKLPASDAQQEAS